MCSIINETRYSFNISKINIQIHLYNINQPISLLLQMATE